MTSINIGVAFQNELDDLFTSKSLDFVGNRKVTKICCAEKSLSMSYILLKRR